MSEQQQPSPVTAWSAVLARIERSLAQSLERCPELPAARGGALPPPGAREVDGPLRQLDQRLGQWQAWLERLGRKAGDAEDGLDGDLEAVRGWLEASAASRQQQRLAEKKED
jgi:hypothetical protein